MQALAIQSLVRRLLTYEAAGSRDQTALLEAAERVFEKLRTHLSKRIGHEGFRTLLARALTLTVPDFPHLKAVRIGENGALNGLSGQAQPGGDTQAPEATVEGAVALIALFLALLITFVGQDLTLGILTSVWPDFAVDDTTVWENQ